jgi:hypothetical protein
MTCSRRLDNFAHVAVLKSTPTRLCFFPTRLAENKPHFSVLRARSEEKWEQDFSAVF